MMASVPVLLADVPNKPLVSVTAVFVPPSAGAADGSVEARFASSDPQIVVNETPPPRLELDPEQTILIDRQLPTAPRRVPLNPSKMKHLDLAQPVRFKVAIAPNAAAGRHSVSAVVVHYYCSKREGWCKKGRAPVNLRVDVP
jgi:hypothetical protein